MKNYHNKKDKFEKQYEESINHKEYELLLD